MADTVRSGASRSILIADGIRAAAARTAAPASVERFVVLGPKYEDLLKDANSGRCPVTVTETDVFSVPYTSGATGRAKGVMLAHRGRVLSCYAMAVEHGCYTPDDR